MFDLQKIFLMFLVLFFPFSAVAADFKAKVIKVYDGDTITVKLLSGKKEKIRLAGIDAPEKDQSYGVQSQRFLSSLVLNKRVKIRSVNRDKYGRIVGFIFLGSDNINFHMVNAGFAWVYKSFCKFDICSDMLNAENKAHKGKFGLWTEYAPLPPWYYRRYNKK